VYLTVSFSCSRMRTLDFELSSTRPRAGPIWLQEYAVRPLPKALKRLCAQFPSKVTTDMFWLYCRVTGVWIVARIVGGRKGSFAQASLAEELTGCVVGAIPRD
jgi:hypothetical protein